MESLVGQTVVSITGRTYLISAEDGRGWTLVRPDTGSAVRVSRSMVERTRSRLLDGEAVRKQASQKDGGISYTVAIEAGVLAILARTGTPMIYDAAARTFTAAEVGA